MLPSKSFWNVFLVIFINHYVRLLETKFKEQLLWSGNYSNPKLMTLLISIRIRKYLKCQLNCSRNQNDRFIRNYLIYYLCNYTSKLRTINFLYHSFSFYLFSPLSCFFFVFLALCYLYSFYALFFLIFYFILLSISIWSCISHVVIHTIKVVIR